MASRDLSRHPLVALTVGSVLTGIVGTFLSAYYSRKWSENERAVVEQTNRIESSIIAIQNFSDLVYERHTWSGMLASSIIRDAPIEELKARKSEYDRVFVKWNTTYQSNLLTIRKIMRAPRFSKFEEYVDEGLSVMLKRIDTCLTAAYDARLASGSAERSIERLKACRAITLLDQARDCSYEITSGLFELVHSGKGDHELDAAIGQRIDTHCKQGI